ncbi:hypothetical protein [Parathalassolituus penaei]|uniref:MipA/OmpV family protein n=1 Tax=Parathalassolituus penaei TaxID=2997323 RepID=A0A9X3EDZ7_9GAMM|nr:hypothetical protein [Parathalassolituus penaei]MCY0965852.1 hypothetical protein [Parathalassolituus penaei]
MRNYVMRKALCRGLLGLTLATVSGAAMAVDGVYWSRDVPVSAKSGDGTALTMSELELTLPIQQLDAREDGFSSAFTINETRFDWQGATATQSPYYWVGVPLRYYQWRSAQDQLRIHLEPGLMTDGEVTDTKALGANLLLAWRSMPQRDFFWQLGLMVDRRFGDFRPRPNAAIAWHSGNTELLLGFPETRLEYMIQTGWRSWLRAAPDGGVWREQLSGQTGTYEVNYRSWRMGLGSGLEWRSGWWLELEAGLQRARQLEATDATLASVSIEPKPNHYWRAGLAWRF